MLKNSFKFPRAFGEGAKRFSIHEVIVSLANTPVDGLKSDSRKSLTDEYFRYFEKNVTHTAIHVE